MKCPICGKDACAICSCGFCQDCIKKYTHQGCVDKLKEWEAQK